MANLPLLFPIFFPKNLKSQGDQGCYKTSFLFLQEIKPSLLLAIDQPSGLMDIRAGRISRGNHTKMKRIIKGGVEERKTRKHSPNQDQG